ncbi:MAG TPA: hypothetical protein PLQ13_08855 [Candidatus Krumholzibacteria bacterium]|nr:hypothetical protein [Candidatus Krumholzibacteria bacterium]
MPLHASAARRAVWALAAAAALATAAAAPAATLEITGTPGAALRINGVEAGTLPLAGPLTLSPGAYEVEARLRGYDGDKRLVRIESDADALQLQVRLGPLSRRTAALSSVLYAGLGQFYTGHDTRGWIYAAAETGGLLTALAGELQRTNLRQDYLVLMDAYNATINADQATYYRQQAAKTYADMEDMEKLRDTGLIVAVAAVGLSVLDALITFPAVEAGPGPVPPVLGATELPGDALADLRGAHAAFKLTF